MIESPDEPANSFARTFTTYVDAFSRLMIVLRAKCWGDLDAALILAVVGERHFARRVCPNTPTPETLGSTPVNDAPTINSYSLSQYTGIPRETVRRKVTTLVERGWLTCDDRGNLAPTTKAAEELQEATDMTMTLIRTMKDGGPLPDAAGRNRRDEASP